MTLRWAWDWWIVALVALVLLAICVHGLLRARSSDEGTQWSWVRRTGMVLCVVVVGMAPAIPAEETEVGTNADVFFVVDRTGSMAAEDYEDAQPRLAGVRADMAEIVESMPGARFSIVAFDSQATRELPLTSDARAVGTWVDTLRQEVTYYSGGSSIDRPRQSLTEALARAEESSPGNVRLVFVLSDGENTAGDTSQQQLPGAWSDSAPYIDGGAVLGYGTADGGQMRSYDGTERTGPGTTAPYIIDDSTGEPAISTIDEANLRTVAEELGVGYEHRTQPGGLDQLVAGIDVEAIARVDGRQNVDVYRDVWWPAMYVLVALLAWEAFELARRMRATFDTEATRRAALAARAGSGGRGGPGAGGGAAGGPRASGGRS
ncbi:vWA domain-containing protein [Georgenia sp. Z1491]|uniref:vWA domain-containing protein n=1 Tax=Georgenia sp. Z1491 TaxID=3416707 RepID=UPI003CF7F155